MNTFLKTMEKRPEINQKLVQTATKKETNKTKKSKVKPKKSLLSLIKYLQLPSDWHKKFCYREVYCTELEQFSDEYELVHNQITSTFKCNVTSIKRIENPFLHGCYLLKKSEYEAKGITVKEKKLFHCTAKQNVSNIVKNNFDWRKTVRGKFGQGVSFSPSAKYANKYANSSIGIERALIMVKVLVGNVVKGSYGCKIPPLSFDATSGNGRQVYVKYCDYEFYPMFVAYYSLN